MVRSHFDSPPKATSNPPWLPVQFLYRLDSVLELAARNGRRQYARDGKHWARWQQEDIMPLVDIQLIKGVFTPEQKKNMIAKVTDAMVTVEGESMRGVTWVRVQEIESGDWAIGGKPLTSEAVRSMAAS